MATEIWLVVGVGVFLMVAWTLAGWWIVRMGFLRDRDAVGHPHADADSPARRVPVRAAAEDDPNAIWRAQMKAATLASGVRCDCGAGVGFPGGAETDDGATGGTPGAAAGSPAALAVEPDPDCPVHRWDFA